MTRPTTGEEREIGENIKLMEIEFADGEMGLVAWGVHDPAEFVARCAEYAIGPEDVDLVRHVRYSQQEREGYDFWLEPVQGEPNATEYRP